MCLMELFLSYTLMALILTVLFVELISAAYAVTRTHEGYTLVSVLMSFYHFT